MKEIPQIILLTFILTTLATLILFYFAIRSAGENKKTLAAKVSIALLIWLVISAALSLCGVFSDNTEALPPRLFIFGVFPTLLVIILLLVTKNGKKFTDVLPLRHLTLLSVVRIPVELVLYGLFLHHAVPELMTFAGRNFDIIAGISAPIMAWLAFSPQPKRKLLIAWNIICLLLLGNIVSIAILSAPFPLQQLAFEQPNVAVLYFPYSWLPIFIVPVVLYTHLASLRQLIIKTRNQVR